MIMPTNYTNLYNDYAYKLLDNQFLDKQHSEIFNIFNLLAAMYATTCAYYSVHILYHLHVTLLPGLTTPSLLQLDEITAVLQLVHRHATILLRFDKL